MRNSKNKLFIFIFGLMFGLALGAVTVFWKFSDQNIGLLVEKKVDEAADKLFSQSDIEAVIDEKLRKLEDEKRKSDTKFSVRTRKRPDEKDLIENGKNPIVANDSISPNELMNEIKEGFRFSERDSLLNDSLQTSDNSENVVVKKDELILAKTFEAYDLSTSGTVSFNEKDTLFEKVTGVSQSNSNQYKIEFWRSPLNYKGYKMSKNLIVLFGFYEKDQYQMYKFENDVFLKHHQNVYHLKNSGDFKPMDKVTDETVLRALNDLKTE